MKNIKYLNAFVCSLLALSFSVSISQENRYLKTEPLVEKLKDSVKPWDNSKTVVKVPLIAWGADMQTILANGNGRTTQQGSIFQTKGLNLELYREDVFEDQVRAYLKGETPFLRGTLGMINMAAEVANRSPLTKLNVIYQLSWSAGGDALVVKDNIRKPTDLKGKTVAVQAYGPHVDYLTTVLSSVGLKPSDITIKWVPDLFDVGEGSYSPAMALQSDNAVDAAMVIIPDALALTSGGNVGTGAEQSVSGAKILLSTKTADRIISDVYAVRQDFVDNNPGYIETFVAGLLEGEQDLRKLSQEKNDSWKSLVKASAGILLDDDNAVEDMGAMLSDAYLSGLQGNIKFFQDGKYLRRFEVLNQEIQSAFTNLSLIKTESPISGPHFEFDTIADVGSDFEETIEETGFDPNLVAAIISKKNQEDSLEDGELYSFEIHFSPNQNSFSSDQYENEFKRVMQLVATYGGALLTIEGHSDPLGYLKFKKEGKDRDTLNKIKQTAKNLSYKRATSVKKSLMTFAGELGVELDENQFGIIGHGIMKPNTSGVAYDNTGDLALSAAPKTKEEWELSRRVVFRLIQVEAETKTFEPIF